MSERAKAKQIQVEVSGASSAGTLQELIEDRKIYRPANIDVTPGEYDIEISSSTGTPGTIPSATITTAGAMSKDDKVKVNDLPDAAGLAVSLSKKVDKVSGEKLITDDQATKLDELPDSAALSAALGNKVDKVTGSKLITNDQAAKLDGLPDSEALGVSLSNKVDKAPGYTLVADAEAVKLSGLPDSDALSVALSNKVDKVSGSKLITDDQSTKLDALPEKSALDLSLDEKVDKVQGHSLIDDDEAIKLAALPTADVLNDALDSKVDSESGKGLITPSPLTGALYGQRNGVWAEVPSGGGGGASALGDLSDVTLGTLADGEVLAWDEAAGKWINKVSQGGASALADLTDVDFGTPTDGQVLTWDDATQMSKFTDQTGGGGDVEEAPLDGEAYGRKDGAWAVVPSPVDAILDFGYDENTGTDRFLLNSDFPDDTKRYSGLVQLLGLPMRYVATPLFGYFGGYATLGRHIEYATLYQSIYYKIPYLILKELGTGSESYIPILTGTELSSGELSQLNNLTGDFSVTGGSFYFIDRTDLGLVDLTLNIPAGLAGQKLSVSETGTGVGLNFDTNGLSTIPLNPDISYTPFEDMLVGKPLYMGVDSSGFEYKVWFTTYPDVTIHFETQNPNQHYLTVFF